MNDRIKAISGLPAPLKPAPDMPNRWADTDQDFDKAAEALLRAHRDDGAARDLPVLDLRAQAVAEERGRFTLRHLAGGDSPRVLRANALGHLCARLGAPVEFVRDRLPAPLQLATMNFLLSQCEQASATLRLRGNEVAAIVSERYAALDPGALVEVLRAALGRHGMLSTVRVRAVATGLVDVLRLTFPADAHEIEVGDVTHVGLDISTSSFGRSAIHVKGLLWRLRCKNGLRTPTGLGDFSLRHVGEVARLRDAVTEVVPTAVAHARGLVDSWRRSVSTYVEGLPALIESMRQLTEGEKATVRGELGAQSVKELPARGRLYDIVNAITSAAQGAVPGRRLELEGLAGDVLHAQGRGVR
jgi:hypothetical protein